MGEHQTVVFDRQTLKTNAKTQIKGSIGILFVCNLIVFAISSVAAPVFGAGFLIMPSFSISMVMIYLALAESARPHAGDVFNGFSLFGKALWLSVITGFFTFAWSLLLIVPGVIKSYAYSMAPYILAENPNMTAREALKESIRITNGYKSRLFVLQLSFIGWALLVPLTFGLIAIWLVPYMSAATANAYLAIKENAGQ